MNASQYNSISQQIKERASELGFDLCGIAPSHPLPEREKILRDWCKRGMNGGMGYLERSIEKRVNPDFLLPGAKSVIVMGSNYYTSDNQVEKDVPILSRYAFGSDYHDVIIKKLDQIIDLIKDQVVETECRSFVDSEPLLEKAWAVEAGLGWQGRHSIVINDKLGSFFFIGIILLNIELEYDSPYKVNRCGNCRLCIDLCPTSAINENGTIDARKCIANLTIENRGPIPEEIIPKIGGRVYGCDKCQEVCPWNKHVKSHHIAEFELSEELRQMKIEEWLNLTSDQFDRLFKNSPVKRRKYEPFMSNVKIAAKLIK